MRVRTYLWLLLLGGEVLLLLQQLQLLGRSLRLIAEHSLEQKKYTLSEIHQQQTLQL